MKRTNLVLDEQLLEEVTRVSGERTYSRAVTRAIEDYLRRYQAGCILELAESGAWEGNISEMRGDVQELGIGEGDALLFERTPDHSIQLRVVENRRALADLYGALPAARPCPGKEKVRQAVGRDLGKVRQEEGA